VFAMRSASARQWLCFRIPPARLAPHLGLRWQSASDDTALECADLSTLSAGDLSPSRVWRRGQLHLEPLDAALLRRQAGAATKAATSRRTPKPGGKSIPSSFITPHRQSSHISIAKESWERLAEEWNSFLRRSFLCPRSVQRLSACSSLCHGLRWYIAGDDTALVWAVTPEFGARRAERPPGRRVLVRLRRRWDRTMRVRSRAARSRAVSNRNCVAERRGGEQRNENDPSETQSGQQDRPP